MPISEEKQDHHPPGYPTENVETGKKKRLRGTTKKRGDRSFIEGCLFGLCCCWLCEACC
ncbi:hypothetical protein IC582_008983 [Cucumis melo]